MLYRQEDLEDKFIKETQKLHDEQVAAFEKCIKDSSLKRVCPPPDQLDKKRDAKQLLAAFMLLGAIAQETTGYSYILDDD